MVTHACSSDATLSKVWQGSSLLPVLYRTHYANLSDEYAAGFEQMLVESSSNSHLNEDLATVEGFADLQRVLWKSAEGLQSMLDKVTGSLA